MARSHSPGDLDDFWQEFQNIESSKEHNGEEEETAKTPDEGEQEAAWLHEAGYGFLVSKYEAGKELQDDEIHALTSSLPSNHAAVVKRRVDTLNATLKKKQKYTTKIDVRNIFPEQRNSEPQVFHSEAKEDPPSKAVQKLSPVPASPDPLSDSVFIFNKPANDNFPPVFSPDQVQSIKPSDDLEVFIQKKSAFLHSPSAVTPSLTPPFCRDFQKNRRDCVDGYHGNQIFPLQRSDSHDSGSPLTSPARSKSSSCDTLDSLDSGLELCSSTLTKDSSSYKDYLCVSGGTIASPYTYQVGQFSPTRGSYLANLRQNEFSSPPCSPDSPREVSSPTLVAYRKRRGTIKEMPKSPATSPRGEVVHPEWANQIRTDKGRAAFMKNKGGYSMSGIMTEEVQGNTEYGIEMLSMEQKGTFQKRNSQLSPISDSDITFDFGIEENGNSRLDNGGKSMSLKSQKEDNLPNFSLVHDKLGITCVEDISDADLDQVKKHALLEMTAMYDNHNIMYSRKRTKKRHKEQGIFGLPLVSIMEHDQRRKANTKIPLVFQEILSYLVKYCLDTEGILRVPGSSSRVQQLRQEMEDKFYQGKFIWGDDLTPNDVAALMKQFLRELPIPLLTDEYIEAFAQVENLPDKMQQLHVLNLLVLLLPSVHRDMLEAVLGFLEKVVEHSATNKMSLSNVAMIMAPNLFMSPKVRASPLGKTKRAWEIEIKMAAGTSNVMRMLIKYRHILWTIPSSLLALVRRQYELEQIRKNKDKSKMKFMAKKDKTEVYKKPALKHEADFQEGVIRIQAPNLTKSSTAIQLDNNTTAGDIVSKFKVGQTLQTTDQRRNTQQNSTTGQIFSDPRNFTFAGDDTFLFEVGGNIGERCLPNNTNMMALYKVNPNAEWIIKQRAR